jgi:hypothetical protein
MLNGMERTLERFLPERDRRWPEKGQGAAAGGEASGFSVQEEPAEYYVEMPPGYPEPCPPAPPRPPEP